jgi:hypothetical protein
VFVVWNSVTRPISGVIRSILPWTPPVAVAETAHVVDAVAFHVPSSWGESQHALRIALGSPSRWIQPNDPNRPWLRFAPSQRGRTSEGLTPTVEDDDEAKRRGWADKSEYRIAVDSAVGDGEVRAFHGFDVPMSVILDELIRIRGEPQGALKEAPGPRIHVVGHSFGAKLASLAAHDAVQRRVVREFLVAAKDGRDVPTSPLIDSLVLLLPAMTKPEMYCEVPFDFDDDQMNAARGRLKSLFRSGTLDDPPLSGLGLGSADPCVKYGECARRIGSKVLVHSSEDSANGWVFALGDFLLSNDAVTRSNLFLGVAADEESGLGWKIMTFPLEILGLAEGAVLTALDTVASDVFGIASGSQKAFERTDGDLSSTSPWVSVPRDVACLPFSALFGAHRSMGNSGLAGVPPIFSGDWLDEEATALFKDRVVQNTRDFEIASRASSAPTSVLPAADPGEWISYNASTIYDGEIASHGAFFGGLFNAFPPGAHDDIRSPEEPAADPGHGSKRERTFRFVFNVTHVRPPSVERP